ncbi:MAG: GntR family transcriptional regulator [Hyphomicrobiaceae bacterium]
MPTNHFSTRPLYLQLRDALAERVAAGEWKPGTAIPNEGDLAREFGVSAGTMRKALDLLEDEHLVTRRQGRGTFVNDQNSEELAVRFCNVRKPDGRRIVGRFRNVSLTEATASEMECARLQITPQDRVFRAERIRLDQERPFMVEALSIPAALFPDFAVSVGALPHVTELAQRYGILLGKAEERVSVETASGEIAKTLGIAVGVPVAVLDRVVFALDDRRPVEWRIGRCHLGAGHYLAEMK